MMMSLHQWRRKEPLMTSIKISVWPLTHYPVTYFSSNWKGMERYARYGWTVQWMKHWLQDQVQRVVVNVSVSGLRSVKSSVSQGSALGLILLNIFISDIGSRVECSQRDCWWHQAVGCNWRTRGTGCNPEGPSGPGWTAWGSNNPNARACTWIEATLNTSTNWGMKGLSTALLKKSWGSWAWDSDMPLQPRKPSVSWSAKDTWPAGRGRWSCPSTLCWWGLTWSIVSWCGVLSTGETWTCWNASKDGLQRSLPTLRILWFYELTRATGILWQVLGWFSALEIQDTALKREGHCEGTEMITIK